MTGGTDKRLGQVQNELGENDMDTIPTAVHEPKAALAAALRNPLVVFGLVFLAGDGPLVVAYGITKDPIQARVLMIASILFVFGMAIFFCYLVAYKPRHLYAPTEIPESAIGNSLFYEPLKDAQEMAESLAVVQSKTDRESIANNLSESLKQASLLQTANELLMIPGYDLSLIRDILESANSQGSIRPAAIGKARNITPSTIEIIMDSMSSRKLIKLNDRRWQITDEGKILLNYLKTKLGAPLAVAS